MGDHRDRGFKRAHGNEVEDLVRTLRNLERGLVAVLGDRKRPSRMREFPPGDEYDDYTSRDRDSLYDDSDCDDSSSSSSSSSGYGRGGHRQFPCRTELIVSGTLPVPCEKPDIESILRFMPVCKVTHWECVRTGDGPKVVVTGVAEIGVEYVADMPDQPLHFAHFTQPFHTFFLCDREIDEVHCEVEFNHSELLDHRCISQVILLVVWGE